MLTAKEILQNFYREETAFVAAKGMDPSADPSAMLTWMSPNLVLTQSADLPWGGEWKGYEGFGTWAAQMSEKFTVLEVQNAVIYETKEQPEPQGPVEEILSRSTLHLKVRGTGDDFIEPLVQIITVNKDTQQIETIKPMYWNVGGLNALLRKAGFIQ